MLGRSAGGLKDGVEVSPDLIEKFGCNGAKVVRITGVDRGNLGTAHHRRDRKTRPWEIVNLHIALPAAVCGAGYHQNPGQAMFLL